MNLNLTNVKIYDIVKIIGDKIMDIVGYIAVILVVLVAAGIYVLKRLFGGGRFV